MKPFRFISRAAVTLLLLTEALFSARLNAADVSVSSVLSRAQISQGEMAELQIKVSGAQQADVPQQIQADGLQIRLTGQSTQVQMVNFKVFSSVVYSYIVMPLRTGSFIIPGASITADGRQFRTPELSFKVDDAKAQSVDPSAGSPQSAQGTQPPGIPMPGFQQQRARPVQQRPDEGRLAFGEINCPKKTLYAGEMTPVEIRYYFDARYPVQVRGRVDFGCEGILVERFPDPKQTREDRDGITYNVLTFHSLLSAVKPGSLDVAPAKLDCEIEMAGALPPGFDDPVFRQLMGGRAGVSQQKQVTVKTFGLHLEVLPLPKEGRPESFAGAVGQFDIDSIVSNPHPAAGDPANLVVKIGGRGNFKGMGAPVLTHAEGWRSYPPSDKFDSSDELSYTGVKSFDFTLIAQQPQKESPGCEFSYFDPTTAKYVTLTSKSLPLVASPGGASPAISGSTTLSPTPVPSPGQNPTKNMPPKEGQPLLGINLRSWTTPMQRSEFLIATLAMLVATAALAAILAYWKIQSQGGTLASRRRKHIAQLRSLLTGGTVDAGSFYEAALEYAELVVPPSEKRDALISGLTERRDVLKYGSGGSLPLPAIEHRKLLESLELTTTKAP